MNKTDIKKKLIDVVVMYFGQVYPKLNCPDLNYSKDPLIDILEIDSLMSIELSMDIMDKFEITDEKIQSILIDSKSLKFPKKLNIDEIVDKIYAYLN